VRRAFVVALVLSSLTLFVLPVRAATSVSIANFRFGPRIVTVAQGGSVTWHNVAGGYGMPRTHTSTQNGPLHLWNTGHIVPGATSVSVQLLAAGAYAYHCNIHSYMHGVVRVPILVSPRHGTGMTNFTIRLASATRSGFTFDVQRKIGSGAWKTWKTAVRSRIVTFRHGPGTYRFRSRLHKVANGATSGWSPPARITIG
jgi:plastocyanin